MTHYLEPFTKALATLPPGSLRSQFHDSFEYQANWAAEVPGKFKQLHGYDLLEHVAERHIRRERRADGGDVLGQARIPRIDRRGAVFANAELGGWQLAFDAGHREKELRSMNSGFAFDYDIDADTYALRARHDGSVAGLKNSFVIGYDYEDWQRNVLGAFGSEANQRSRGIYAKDDITLAGGTRLSLGARRSSIDKSNAGSGFDDALTTAMILAIARPPGGR